MSDKKTRPKAIAKLFAGAVGAVAGVRAGVVLGAAEMMKTDPPVKIAKLEVQESATKRGILGLLPTLFPSAMALEGAKSEAKLEAKLEAEAEAETTELLVRKLHRRLQRKEELDAELEALRRKEEALDEEVWKLRQEAAAPAGRGKVLALTRRLREDFRLSRAWENEMDRLEEAAAFDPERLLAALPDVSEDERQLVAAGEEAELWRRLLTFLRWRHDLRGSVGAILRAAAAPTPSTPDARGLRTAWNVPRLRLAVRGAEEVDALPPDSVAALRGVGCVSSAPGRRLSTALAEAGEDELRLLRCLVIRHHRDVHTALLRRFLEADPAAAPDFLHGVPPLPRPHVRREALQGSVGRWLAASDSNSGRSPLLVLLGVGGAGKSTLAAHAAHAALERGFHRVVWLRAGEWETESDEKRVAQLVGCRDRALVVLDDVADDAALQLLPSKTAAIVTTRHRSIGAQFKQREELAVGGLTADECRAAIAAGMGAEAAAMLEERKLWPSVLRLCERAQLMPLTVGILASLLRDDVREWTRRGRSFFDTLRAELRSAPASPLQHVSAAVAVSLDRLDDDERERYRQLSIFDRGWRIAPVTMAAVWDVTEPEATAAVLAFCSRCLLHEGVDAAEQRVFVLHDLLHDALAAATTERQRQEWRRLALGRYSARLERVDARDRFLVPLCLRLGAVEVAAAFVGRLALAMERTKLGLIDAHLDELDAVRCRSPDDQRPAQLLDLLQTLNGAQARPDDVLRAALARPELARVRAEAAAMAAAEPGRARALFALEEAEAGAGAEGAALLWVEEVADFVLVGLDRAARRLRARTLLRPRTLLSAPAPATVTGLDRALTSVGARGVAVAVGARLWAWAGDGAAERVQLPGPAAAVCHSHARGDVCALAAVDGDAVLLRVDAGRATPVLRVAAGLGLARCAMWVCDRAQALVLAPEGGAGPCRVLSLAGDAELRADGVSGCLVGRGRRRVVLWRAEAEEWTLAVFDLRTRARELDWAGEGVLSAALSASEARLALLTRAGQLRVLQFGLKGHSWVAALPAPGQRLLAFAADERSVLVRRADGVASVPCEPGAGGEDAGCVVWDRRWSRAGKLSAVEADPKGSAVVLVLDRGVVAILRRVD